MLALMLLASLMRIFSSEAAACEESIADLPTGDKCSRLTNFHLACNTVHLLHIAFACCT